MSYGNYNSYGNRPYDPNPFGDDNGYGGGGHEMSSYGQGQGYVSPGYGGAPTNENQILGECRDIQNGIDTVENNLKTLGALQKRSLDDADTSGGSATKRELDALTQSTMDQYRALTDRVREVRRNPDSRQAVNARQVELTEGRLKRAIQKFQEMESASRKEMRARVERQARIVNPDATDAEIAQIVNSDTQVFQQAVMGARAEQANRVLGAVKQRHQEMLQIERSLMDLLDLLNDMQELLAKQEVTVNAIDMHAENAAGDMVKANEQLEVAVTTARKTRKKKWICLGICVAIIVIIVVAVVAYVMVNRAANNKDDGGKKRSLFQRSALENLEMNTGRAVKISVEQSQAEPLARFAKRGANRVRRLEMRSNAEVEAATKKRFVVTWELEDPKGGEKAGHKI
ncbi:hypothetical protein N0V88_006077 [Collariella sp. IMI 366227]|nr:hypothetical protein N0V88_006077 [Collariella sp. IMI 366227]